MVRDQREPGLRPAPEAGWQKAKVDGDDRAGPTALRVLKRVAEALFFGSRMAVSNVFFFSS